MAKKEGRPTEFRIKELELEIEDREREMLGFREELAQINAQLERFIGQMAEQLNLANVIQKSLVPTEIPTIPGFEFSTKFVPSPTNGGDYFDIFELEDKLKFGVLLANSSGYGMASLLLSVLLKLTTQIEARKGLDPAQVLKKMNDEIQNKIKEAQSAHVFYATVDRSSLELTYSKSGGIFAYVFKNEHDKFVKLESTQGVLGEKMSKGAFKKESITLDPRDRLILVSESLTKVKNKKDETFKEDDLLNYLIDHSRVSCHEMRNEILFQIKQFAQGLDYPQDVSVIVMRIKDKVLRIKKS